MGYHIKCQGYLETKKTVFREKTVRHLCTLSSKKKIRIKKTELNFYLIIYLIRIQ